MTKPLFATLYANHYSSDLNQVGRYVDGTDVYTEIGYDIDKLMKQDPNYRNTCATRMSMALMKSGVPMSGRMKVKAGALKGRSIEPGAKLLADQLSQKHLLGKPQILKPSEALKKLEGKQGVVFFWKMTGYSGGHIDLIKVDKAAEVCSSRCYLTSGEIWFWPLD